MVVSHTTIAGSEKVQGAAPMVRFRVCQCVFHIHHVKKIELKEFVGNLQSLITLINQFRLLC